MTELIPQHHLEPRESKVKARRPIKSAHEDAKRALEIEQIDSELTGYQVTGKLGQGGFGSVYAGYDLGLDREVAIKVFIRESDATAAERFKDEGRLLAKLHHTHIVQVYQMGTLSDGRSFLVMERFGEGSIKDHWPRGTTPPLSESALIIIQLLRALEAAHNLGVVHRDIKEANVLYNRALKHIKLCDFGIARALERLSDQAQTTREGVVIGTEHYIAPERYQGRRHDLRSDLYSVGVILYRLLTGRRPLERYAGERLTPEMLIYRLFSEETRGLDDIPKAISAVCLKLLEVKADRRYQDAGVAALDLEQALSQALSQTLSQTLSQPRIDSGSHTPSTIQRAVERHNSLRDSRGAEEIKPDAIEALNVKPKPPPIAHHMHEAAFGQLHNQSQLPDEEQLPNESPDPIPSRGAVRQPALLRPRALKPPSIEFGVLSTDHNVGLSARLVHVLGDVSSVSPRPRHLMFLCIGGLIMAFWMWSTRLGFDHQEQLVEMRPSGLSSAGVVIKPVLRSRTSPKSSPQSSLVTSSDRPTSAERSSVSPSPSPSPSPSLSPSHSVTLGVAAPKSTALRPSHLPSRRPRDRSHSHTTAQTHDRSQKRSPTRRRVKRRSKARIPTRRRQDVSLPFVYPSK